MDNRLSKLVASAYVVTGLFLSTLIGAPGSPAIASTVKVAVWSDPTFDSDLGCNNESVNLRNLVTNTTGFTLEGSIAKMSDETTQSLQTKLNAAGFFFVPDIEDVSVASVIDSTKAAVLRDWVSAGGVFVQTGTAGAKDAELLNLIFSFSPSIASVGVANTKTWAKNDANVVGTPYSDGPSSLSWLSATDAFNGTGITGFKAMYGTTSDAAVATIPFGRGTVVVLGWDYFAGGPTGCSASSNAWVTQIFPQTLRYAAQLSSSGLENPTTQGGTLKYSFSSNGTAYYAVQARATAAPADGAAIKTLATSVPPGGLTRGSASLTGGVELSFNITGLSPATDYSVYAVTEYTNLSSQVVFSSVEKVDFSTVPGVPTVSSVTPGNNQVSVAIAPFGSETNFEYTINGGSSWVARSAAATTSPWVISGLTNGQSYTFSFRSAYQNLKSAATASFTVTPANLPTVPRSLAVTFGSESGASLSWIAPTSDGGSAITGYSVQYDSGAGWQAVTPSGLTASVPSVWLDENWSFRVAAVTSAGTGPYATYNHTAAVPATLSPPAGPTTLVTDNNRNDIAAPLGFSNAGTISGGVVTQVSSGVTRVTSQTPTDIRSDIETIISVFNSKWGGVGTLTPPVTSVESTDGALVYGLLSNSQTSAPLGVPAQDVLLVTTSTKAVMLAASSNNQPAKVNAEGVLVVSQESTVAVAAHGLPANTAGELVLLSTPTLLGSFTTDANGSFIGQTTLPPGIAPGNHTVVLITSDFVASLGLSVLSLPTVGGISRPYEGPLNLVHAPGKFCSGGEAVLLGQRLSTIEEVWVAGRKVEFKLVDAGRLSYSLNGISAGKLPVRLSVPISSVNLLTEVTVTNCAKTSISNSTKVNVGSFNGKLVVYAYGLNGARISWKVGGNWGSAVSASNYSIFNRPTPRAGVTVSVDIYVNGVKTLTKSVVTR